MKHFSFLVLCTILSVSAADITLSKDSLKVCNSTMLNTNDSLGISNNATSTVYVDSVKIVFDQFDTAGVIIGTGYNGLQAYWNEYDPYCNLQWFMVGDGILTYTLRKAYFYPANLSPMTIASGTSRSIGSMQIGENIGSERPPVYPKYLHGKMLLYFNNSQIVEVTIYSNDLRTSVVSRINRSPSLNTQMSARKYLLNGRCIQNGNKIDFKRNHGIIITRDKKIVLNKINECEAQEKSLNKRVSFFIPNICPRKKPSHVA